MKLYAGLNLPKNLAEEGYYHYPLIRIVRRKNIGSVYFDQATHIIFTSQTAVSLFCTGRDMVGKVIISVGASTTDALLKHGIQVDHTATDERAEGVVEVLRSLKCDHPFFLWPHSSAARTVITDFLRERGLSFYDFSLYDIEVNKSQNLPKLHELEEVYFTSPSTVDAFFKLYGSIPKDITLRAIGPVTQKYIERFLR